MTSFLPPSGLRIYSRILPFAALTLLLMWIVMGLLAASGPYVQLAQEHVAVSPRAYPIGGLPWKAAAHHAYQTLDYIVFYPDECKKGHQINDFQVEQCKKFKSVLADYLALFALPWVTVLFVVAYLRTRVLFFYRRARHALRAPEHEAVGTVTDPPQGPSDLLTWLYGVQAICVQRSPGAQEVVWMSSRVEAPNPGQKVALYSLSREGGKKRTIALFFAPHMAVFSSRTR